MKHKIHFVCRGNEYRSRIAEAWMRMLDDPSIEASSSGLEAGRYVHNGPGYLVPYTASVGKLFGLTPYFSSQRVRTTQELLDSADIIVFMSKTVREDAEQQFTLNPDKVLSWHVKDVSATRAARKAARTTAPAVARRTAMHIKRLCQKLRRDVTAGSWVDVVDADNNPRGFALPISLACRKGVWWRGCHAVLTTPSGHYLVEKRSSTIIFSPGLLDITLGGAVDMGEAPEVAIVRETREELGVTIKSSHLQLVDKRKWDAYHPRYHTYTRVFLYTYHAPLATDDPDISPQRKEVADVRQLSYRQVQTLLRRHRLRSIGRLKSSYKYFGVIVAASQAIVSK